IAASSPLRSRRTARGPARRTCGCVAEQILWCLQGGDCRDRPQMADIQLHVVERQSLEVPGSSVHERSETYPDATALVVAERHRHIVGRACEEAVVVQWGNENR